MGQVRPGAYHGFTVQELPGGQTQISVHGLGPVLFNANGYAVETAVEAPAPVPADTTPGAGNPAPPERALPRIEPGWSRGLRKRDT